MSQDGSEFLGHASVIANVAGLRVGFDCHLGGTVFQTWKFVPEPTEPKAETLDILCLSHSHQDHVDARVIARLRPGSRLIIPANRPQLSALVEHACPIGVEVLAWPHWQTRDMGEWWALGDGVTLTCIPSDRNDTDAAWLLQAPSGFSLWHGNDAFMRRETLERVRRELAPRGVTHCYAAYSYVHWFPFCVETLTPEQRSAESKRCVQESLDAMAMTADVLGTRVKIPCGGNLAPMQGSDEWARSVLTPWEAGGVVEDVSDGEEWSGRLRFACPAAIGPDARALIDAARAERKTVAVVYEPMTDRRWGVLSDAFRRANVNGLDTIAGVLRMIDNASGDRLRFHLEPAIWNAWVAGRASFDDVLGSGAFRLWRSPEHFNRDLFARLRRHL